MEEQAYRDMYAADDLLDGIAENDKRRAAEWAEMCREYAHREDVAPAWQTAIDSVEAGELSWHDIASGNAMDHPAVRAAIAADTVLRAEADRDEAPDEDEYYGDFTIYHKR